MTKNPIINALAALLYISIVSLMMFYGTKDSGPDTVVAPIAAISLFTLSAAVMGYLFCYEPIQLYFEGAKKQAIDLFLKTVGVFGGITFLLLLTVFSGAFSQNKSIPYQQPATSDKPMTKEMCEEQNGQWGWMEVMRSAEDGGDDLFYQCSCPNNGPIVRDGQMGSCK